MVTKRKQASGGARLIARGLHPVTLGLSRVDHDALVRAAAEERRPLTQFLLFHGLRAAKKILEKSLNSS